MLPWHRANEVLDDLALDLDEHRDVLGILAWQMGQQPLEVEMHGMLIGFGLQSLLIGHDELTQTIYHLREDVGGNKTIAQHFFSPLCPWSRRTAPVLPLSSGFPPSAPRTGQVAFTTSGAPT